MEVRLTFAEGGSEQDAEGVYRTDCATSLYRWLIADPELSGLARIAVVPTQSRPGHMGEALEVVNVVLSNTIALSSLLVAVSGWRGSRARPPEVRLEREGVTVTVQDASPDRVEQILRALDADNSGSSRETRHGAME